MAGLTRTTPEGAVVEEYRFPEPWEPRVGQAVRLEEFVGTKAQAKLVWKVTEIRPSQVAGGVTQYLIEPVGGGRGMIAQSTHIRAGSDLEQRAADAVVPVARMVMGTVVVLEQPMLRGCTVGTALVVLAENTDGTVKVAPLNGHEKGTYWPKCPRVAVSVVQAEVKA